jgi:CheY-like chemotaxis protein
LARILVVDDNEAAIELAQILLTQSAKLRCVLVGASGGREALSLLRASSERNESVDLVLLDISMPQMDGFEFLTEVRADQQLKGLPIVMCTTSNYDKDMERAKQLGAVGFITKPPELKKLKPLFDAMPTLRLCENADGKLLLRVA